MRKKIANIFRYKTRRIGWMMNIRVYFTRELDLFWFFYFMYIVWIDTTIRYNFGINWWLLQNRPNRCQHTVSTVSDKIKFLQVLRYTLSDRVLFEFISVSHWKQIKYHTHINNVKSLIRGKQTGRIRIYSMKFKSFYSK